MEQKSQAIFSWGINTTARHPVSSGGFLEPTKRTLSVHSAPASDLYILECVLERHSQTGRLLLYTQSLAGQ